MDIAAFFATATKHHHHDDDDGVPSFKLLWYADALLFF
jgi:hypothetical protein